VASHASILKHEHMRFDQADRLSPSVLAVLILTLGLFQAAAAVAQRAVTLAWNPSLATDVVGYRLYYGQTSRTYSAHIDVSTNTSATISDLSVGTNYFFAVTAYTAAGMESEFSAELSYTVPAPDSANLVLQVSPTHHALLTGTAPPGRQFQVFATPDLLNWISIGVLTVDSNGSFRFVDPNAAANARHYYRLQETKP